MNIYAFADEASKEIDLQIKAMLRNGLTGLEIRNVDGQNVSDISLTKAKEVKNKLDANGLITWSIGSPLGKIKITDDFAPHLEKLKHTLEVANALNCKNIRMFSFYIPSGADFADCKNEVMDRLGQFVEATKGSGVNLCHENEKGIYGDIPERCFEILKVFPELKGIFDPANFIQCGVDTKKGWELLKDYIYYMHIKDALKSGQVVPAGKGDGNLAYIANDFVTLGGKDFTIEPHLTVFDGLKDLEREGEETKMAFSYPDSDTAFDTACSSFKALF